ncbi:MAG: 2Fe-2S iron-sulfur cluster-binding protein [Halioglobus sp.]
MAVGNLISISVTDRSGTELAVESRADQDNIMQVLYDADQDIEAACGGCASCATCHIYIEPEWMEKTPPRDEIEEMLLQGSEYFDEQRSRLSCQIKLDSSLDGMKLVLAPED